MSNREYLNFNPNINNVLSENDKDLWFIFCNGQLLLKESHEKLENPCTMDIKDFKYLFNKVYNIGVFYGQNCFLTEMNQDIKPSKNFSYHDLRSLSAILDKNRFELCGRALHLLTWYKSNVYCSRCGTLYMDKEGERAKICPDCGFIVYPRISPAIIVAVVKDNKLLLASNKRFPMKFYSVLAGFVEPGETFEDCVKREVYEESKIQVKNIKYFGSQPWPFPDSLMVGFTAEYDGGEIEVDGEEICHAEWFDVETLPEIPKIGSISRELIEWFRSSYSK
jgi:NAD+ diphosphatase